MTVSDVSLSPPLVSSNPQGCSITARLAQGEPRFSSAAQCIPASKPATQTGVFDKLFWVFTRRFWSGWKNALIIVSPETVVRWHLQRGLAQGMRDAVIEICAVQNNEFS